jgi:hypothetical protein
LLPELLEDDHATVPVVAASWGSVVMKRNAPASGFSSVPVDFDSDAPTGSAGSQ